MPVFFLLSGENPALSAAELKHLLLILDEPHSLKIFNDRVAIADVEVNVAREAVQRAAYTKLAGVLLGSGSSLDELVFEDGWSEKVPRFKSFDVSVFEVGGVQVNSVMVEKKVAAEILGKIKGIKVDLTNPEASFIVIVTPKVCVAGLSVVVKPKKFFADRKAGLRPFRIPSALQPKLARCLVNLSVKTRESKVLDPFAGSGAIVVEAGLMGHESVGLEVKTWISDGMRKNVYFYCPSNTHVVQGDAKRLPFIRSFDSVATDPPYGRSATLGGIPLRTLLQNFSKSATSVLREKARMAITVPATYFPDLVDACSMFKLVEYHDLYVHKGLTRRVVVMVLE